MQFVRGQRVKLADVLDSLAFLIDVRIQSSFVADIALFGLNDQNKLLDDAYMVFYNQPVSPCQAIRLTQNDPNFCQFSLDLGRLPTTIQKIVITVSIDGNDVMKNLGNSLVNISDLQGRTVASFALNGTMFVQEQAIMVLEFYQKDNVWRMSAVGQGFNGGLPTLVEYFGAKVADETTASQTITDLTLKKKLSLEKAQKTGNASIVDLTKKSLITLEKKGLLGIKARVALVLDASGSMDWQYKNGDVQKIVNRLMPLAINFDDDGSFECWAFADLTTQLDDVTLNNVNDFVNTTKRGWRNWAVGARINNELLAISAVMDYYVPNNGYTNTKTPSLFGKLFGTAATSTVGASSKHSLELPTYVLFISDGGVGSGRQMERILTDCANLPIFWQFVGVGGSRYGVLEKLDTMTGRVVDNCNFFAINDIGSISDSQLYDKLLSEFPKWLNEAKNKGIIG